MKVKTVPIIDIYHLITKMLNNTSDCATAVANHYRYVRCVCCQVDA